MLNVPKHLQNTQGIIVSRAASIRAKQKDEEHQRQGKEMMASFVKKENYMRAPVDMAQALAKVRTSDITIPVALSRYQGSYLYNKQG